MRAPGLNAERDRPTGLASQPAGVLRTAESAFHLPLGQAWLRRLLLLMPLALALGGCTMVQADPVDRAKPQPRACLRPEPPMMRLGVCG